MLYCFLKNCAHTYVMFEYSPATEKSTRRIIIIIIITINRKLQQLMHSIQYIN